jgi:hypothetical protein
LAHNEIAVFGNSKADVFQFHGLPRVTGCRLQVAGRRIVKDKFSNLRSVTCTM